VFYIPEAMAFKVSTLSYHLPGIFVYSLMNPGFLAKAKPGTLYPTYPGVVNKKPGEERA
jgi:hypothetical protein